MLQKFVETDLLLRRKKTQGYAASSRRASLRVPGSRKEQQQFPMLLSTAGAYGQRSNQETWFLSERRGIMWQPGRMRAANGKPTGFELPAFWKGLRLPRG